MAAIQAHELAPHKASLLRLYGCDPKPSDVLGMLPIDFTGLCVRAHVDGVNFTLKCMLSRMKSKS